MEQEQPDYITATMPMRIAAIIMKAAPKLDEGNLAALEEILGGGAVEACSVDAVMADEVFVGLAALDCADAEADPETALADEPVVVADDVDDEDEDEDVVLEALEVEVTVESIVN